MTFSDIDLWIYEHKGEIKYWEMDRLKSEIEQRFFKKSPSRTILNHGAKYLNRLRLEARFSTASSYEGALKALIKFIMHIKGLKASKIKKLFRISDNGMVPLEEFKSLDIEIKAIDYGFSKDFKAYLTHKYASKTLLRFSCVAYRP